MTLIFFAKIPNDFLDLQKKMVFTTNKLFKEQNHNPYI